MKWLGPPLLLELDRHLSSVRTLREHIPFMWLAGPQRPDFRTLSRFRSQRMKDVLESVFTAVLQFLADEKYVSLEHYFVDGTKIEANANLSISAPLSH